MSLGLNGYIREYGVRDTVERAVCKGVSAVLRSGFRKRNAPLLGELSALSKSVHVSAEDLLREMIVVTNNDLVRLRSEYAACAKSLQQRYHAEDLPYHASFAVEEDSAFLLYSLVRMLTPEVILETGVANGHSSSVILSALDENGNGCLHSVDVSGDVGRLIAPEQKSRWHLHLLKASGLKKSFSELLALLPTIDLMIHDSDHSYQWMRFELETALPKMSQNGIVACDDGHICYGMVDFCLSHNLRPLLLLDKRKVFGIVPLS
jgi:predicted O-methyltransferase YrrM